MEFILAAGADASVLNHEEQSVYNVVVEAADTTG